LAKRKGGPNAPSRRPGREAGAQDAAILAFIALQHGAPAAVICHALAGRDTGPLAAALALVEG
jgi:hypothetical protein